MAPRRVPKRSPVDRPQRFPAKDPRRKRVALLTGCAQQVLGPEINEATVRLLTRHGCEVVVARGSGCCGAIDHHLGRQEPALKAVRANVAAWTREIDTEGLDAVVVNASGCGTMVKDYGFLLQEDAAWAEKAARVSGLARDIAELMAELGLDEPAVRPGLEVAYHSACSLQHGQQIHDEPKRLLAAAGFGVHEVPEGHLCCGSAGTYSLLQPELATALRDRTVANIERVGADLVATGNIGCMVQLAGATRIPVVHTVELLDWATGGPRPRALAGHA
jgi:glycolate oxidase iron-sulfur subunit